MPVFSPNTGKYWPEKAPYFDTFHPVQDSHDDTDYEKRSKVVIL